MTISCDISIVTKVQTETLLWIRECHRQERVLEPVSCVLGSEGKGRSGVIAVIELCSEKQTGRT
jgi:hypothetical protein